MRVRARLCTAGRAPVAFALALFASVLSIGCSREERAAGGGDAAKGERPAAVVLLVWDSVDVTRLSGGRAAVVRLPAFERLVREGASCEGFVPDSTSTTAALAALLSGRPPDALGLSPSLPGRHRLPEAVVTLAERARAAGLSPLGASTRRRDSAPLSGLGQGFLMWSVPAGGESSLAPIERALARFETQLDSGRRPFLLLVDDRAAEAFGPRDEVWRGAFRARLAALPRPPADVPASIADPAGAALDELAARHGRRRGGAVWRALREAEHDAALQRLDRVLARVLDALETRGRLERSLVVLSGGRAGDPWGGTSGIPDGAGPRPRLFAPLVVRAGAALPDSELWRSTVGAHRTLQSSDLGRALAGWLSGAPPPSAEEGGVERVDLRPALVSRADLLTRVAVGGRWLVISGLWDDVALRFDGRETRGGPVSEPPEDPNEAAELERLARALASRPDFGVLALMTGEGVAVEAAFIAVEEGAGLLPDRRPHPLFGHHPDPPLPRAILRCALPSASGERRAPLRVSERAAPFVLRLRLAARPGAIDDREAPVGSRGAFGAGASGSDPPAPGSPAARVAWGAAEGDPPLEARVRIGGRPLVAGDLALLLEPKGPPWPEAPAGGEEPGDSAEAREPLVDIAAEGPRLTVRVAARAGETVRLVIEREGAPPFEPGDLALPAGVSVHAHPRRPHALVVRGEGPLALTLPRAGGARVGLAAFVGGARVPAAAVRCLGRRLAPAGELRLLVTRDAWSDPGCLGAAGEPPPGQVALELLDPPPPEPAVRSSAAERAMLAITREGE